MQSFFHHYHISCILSIVYCGKRFSGNGQKKNKDHLKLPNLWFTIDRSWLTMIRILKSLKLYCDASPKGVGAFLAYVIPNSIEQPVLVVYASQSLQTKTMYAQIGGKLLTKHCVWCKKISPVLSYTCKNLNLKKEVGIAVKVRKQVASHAARPVENTDLYNYNVFSVVLVFSILSLGHILISDLVVANLLMYLLPGMILLYLATPFLHQRCF